MRLRILLAISFLLYLTAFAFAQANGGTPPEDVFSLFKPVLDAVMSGNYVHAAAVSLVFTCALARKWGIKYVPWLGTDAGGALLVLLSSFGGAVATTTASGTLPTTAVLWMALKVGVLAAGGFSLVKKLLVDPILRPLVDKVPPPFKQLLQFVVWIFDKPDPVEQAVKAGKDALEKKPSTGISGVIGGPRDVK